MPELLPNRQADDDIIHQFWIFVKIYLFNLKDRVSGFRGCGDVLTEITLGGIIRRERRILWEQLVDHSRSN
jgi:hypothetical protein